LYAFVAAVVAGTLLVVLADGYLERFAVWVYAVALAAMFGASALYHRYPWRSPTARLRARRLDHAMIFVFIAGTYTAFALVAFTGTARVVGLVTVWAGAALGIFLNLVRIDGPRWLSAAFILEEGLDTDTLETIVRSMAEAAREAGVAIVAGDTKVVQGGGGMYITTAGIGEVPPGLDIRPALGRAGDAILVSGTMGDHHACILSARMGIENAISSDAAPLVQPVQALLSAGVRVRALRDVTRGGLATILHELCGAAGTGALIEEAAVPV
jgi:channel protein (hemolysin III family)